MDHNLPNAVRYQTEAPVPLTPLSARMQDNLNLATSVRNQINDLRGRLFGFGPPTVAGGKDGEPRTSEDVAVLTSSILEDAHNIINEINSRF